MSRTQALVIGFFALALVAFAAIFALAPDIYTTTLKLRATNSRLPELTLLLAQPRPGSNTTNPPKTGD